MWKGLLIFVGVGAAFAYFVFHFVGDVEKEDPYSYVSRDEARAKAGAKYYEKDALGEPVLNLAGVPMKKAREVWRESQLRKEMLDLCPDFEGMKDFVNDRLRPSAFRKKLLERLDDVEGEYLGGSIDSETAKRKLSEI